MGPELAFTGSLTVADSPRNMCGLLKPWISLQGDMALSLPVSSHCLAGLQLTERWRY